MFRFQYLTILLYFLFKIHEIFACSENINIDEEIPIIRSSNLIRTPEEKPVPVSSEFNKEFSVLIDYASSSRVEVPIGTMYSKEVTTRTLGSKENALLRWTLRMISFCTHADTQEFAYLFVMLLDVLYSSHQCSYYRSNSVAEFLLRFPNYKFRVGKQLSCLSAEGHNRINSIVQEAMEYCQNKAVLNLTEPALFLELCQSFDRTLLPPLSKRLPSLVLDSIKSSFSQKDLVSRKSNLLTSGTSMSKVDLPLMTDSPLFESLLVDPDIIRVIVRLLNMNELHGFFTCCKLFAAFRREFYFPPMVRISGILLDNTYEEEVWAIQTKNALSRLKFMTSADKILEVYSTSSIFYSNSVIVGMIADRLIADFPRGFDYDSLKYITECLKSLHMRLESLIGDDASQTETIPSFTSECDTLLHQISELRNQVRIRYFIYLAHLYRVDAWMICYTICLYWYHLWSAGIFHNIYMHFSYFFSELFVWWVWLTFTPLPSKYRSNFFLIFQGLFGLFVRIVFYQEHFEMRQYLTITSCYLIVGFLKPPILTLLCSFIYPFILTRVAALNPSLVALYTCMFQAPLIFNMMAEFFLEIIRNYWIPSCDFSKTPYSVIFAQFFPSF